LPRVHFNILKSKKGSEKSTSGLLAQILSAKESCTGVRSIASFPTATRPLKPAVVLELIALPSDSQTLPHFRTKVAPRSSISFVRLIKNYENKTTKYKDNLGAEHRNFCDFSAK